VRHLVPHTKTVPTQNAHIARRKTHSSLSVLLGLVFLVLPTLAFALTGQVTNHTLARPEANIQVSYIHHAASGVTIVRDTTDQNGRFTLDVTPDPNADPPPMLIARYKNIDYPGNPTQGDTIEIPVYETTDQDTALSIASHHVLVDYNAKQATYIIIVKNSSNRTYLTGGDHGHGLELPLPDGVTEILRAPEGVHLHGYVLVDPRPIIPGQSQSFFSFAFPPNNQLNQTITYATGSFDLLVQPPETEVFTSDLHEHGTVNFGGQTFKQFAAADLAPNARIGIRFQSIKSAEEAGVSQNTLIAVVVIAALFLGAMAFIAIRQPRSKTSPQAPTNNRRSALLEQIADLDDRFESGNITEEVYRTRRDVLKAEVAELSENRQTLLEQIADLDEQLEKGHIDKKRHQQQRDALKKRVANLTDQG
jgi:hypothetical protein